MYLVARKVFGESTAPRPFWRRCLGSQLINSSRGRFALIKAFRREFADQLANPSSPTAPWPIPKIVDFDAEAGRFVLDERQAFKTPDWIYEEPPEAPPSKRPAKAAKPAPRPHDADYADIAVRLRGDVAESMTERSSVDGRTVEALVDEAVREWIQRHPMTPPGR